MVSYTNFWLTHLIELVLGIPTTFECHSPPIVIEEMLFSHNPVVPIVEISRVKHVQCICYLQH